MSRCEEQEEHDEEELHYEAARWPKMKKRNSRYKIKKSIQWNFTAFLADHLWVWLLNIVGTKLKYVLVSNKQSGILITQHGTGWQ